MGIAGEYRAAIRIESQPNTRVSYIVRNWHWDETDPPFTPAVIAPRIAQWMVPPLCDLLPTSCTVTNVFVTYSDEPHAVYWDVALSEAGTFPNAIHLPDAVAGLIRLQWDASDTRHPGKVFIPYVPAFTDAGQVATYLALLQVFAVVCEYAPTPGGSDPQNLQGVVWHRASNMGDPILAGVAVNQFFTQRDRTPRGADAVAMYPMQ